MTIARVPAYSWLDNLAIDNDNALCIRVNYIYLLFTWMVYTEWQLISGICPLAGVDDQT